MDPVFFLISLFVAFLAGCGTGIFVFASTAYRILDRAKAEFVTLRHEAQEKITEAENVIRRVGKTL